MSCPSKTARGRRKVANQPMRSKLTKASKQDCLDGFGGELEANEGDLEDFLVFCFSFYRALYGVYRDC